MTSFNLNGDARPVAGANLPWVDYGFDFGMSAQRGHHVGVSSSSGHLKTKAQFKTLQANRVPLVRWFVLCDGRSGITFDAAGMPTGLEAHVKDDMQRALSIAQSHGVKVQLSLLNYQFGLDAKVGQNGFVEFGHGDVLDTAAGRQALLDNVLTPLLKSIGNHPSVFAIEFMNEPEHLMDIDLSALGGHGRKKPISQKGESVSHPLVGQGMVDFVDFASVVGQKVHELTGKPYTVGSFEAKYASLWLRALEPAQGDFAQFHAYSPLDALDRAALIGLANVPVMVGEFPVAPPGVKPGDLDASYSTWLSQGFASVMGWRAFGSDSATGPLDFNEWNQFVRNHVDGLNMLDQTPKPGLFQKWRDRIRITSPLRGPVVINDGGAALREMQRRGLGTETQRQMTRAATDQRARDQQQRDLLARQRSSEQQRLLQQQLELGRQQQRDRDARARQTMITRSRPTAPSFPPRPPWSGTSHPGGPSGGVFGPIKPQQPPHSRPVWVPARMYTIDHDRTLGGKLIPGPIRGIEFNRVPGHYR